MNTVWKLFRPRLFTRQIRHYAVCVFRNIPKRKKSVIKPENRRWKAKRLVHYFTNFREHTINNMYGENDERAKRTSEKHLIMYADTFRKKITTTMSRLVTRRTFFAQICKKNQRRFESIRISDRTIDRDRETIRRELGKTLGKAECRRQGLAPSSGRGPRSEVSAAGLE